jgi:hypothetical protein
MALKGNDIMKKSDAEGGGGRLTGASQGVKSGV